MCEEQLIKTTVGREVCFLVATFTAHEQSSQRGVDAELQKNVARILPDVKWLMDISLICLKGNRLLFALRKVTLLSAISQCCNLKRI